MELPERLCQTFIKNYHNYVEIVSETIEIPSKFKKALENVSNVFWEKQPIFSNSNWSRMVLDLLQADSTNIGQAVELWLNLMGKESLRTLYGWH